VCGLHGDGAAVAQPAERERCVVHVADARSGRGVDDTLVLQEPFGVVKGGRGHEEQLVDAGEGGCEGGGVIVVGVAEGDAPGGKEGFFGWV
jgi:hypothetical protein